MRDSSILLEPHRIQPRGFESPPGALWGWFKIARRPGYDLRCMSSGPSDSEVGFGWEHVSVSRSDSNVPTWDDMAHVKELFWSDEETVLQFHPKKSEYVNVHPGVLHLWKRAGVDQELPPRHLLA